MIDSKTPQMAADARLAVASPKLPAGDGLAATPEAALAMRAAYREAHPAPEGFLTPAPVERATKLAVPGLPKIRL